MIGWKKERCSAKSDSSSDPSNLELDLCPNNGGKRIFPGKLTPGENPGLRKQVDLVATITPQISGVMVYFRVFDVDDPFDQDNAAMPGVAVIDSDTRGPDNRPTAEGSRVFLSVPTNAQGQAGVAFSVSMQPGNNYRAGASVLQDAINQTDQTIADALNPNGGDWSGYSVPLHWSQMLTVWRKLHVEVDSMAAPDFTNTLTGAIPEAPTFDAATGQAWIPLEDLPNDFKQTDQHRVGRIFILSYGNFTTDRTDKDSTPKRVKIRNAPPNIVNAAGLNYTLWDDDGGSDPNENPPYVMVGFNAPPVTLPKVPDTSLMGGVYRDAYVDVPPPDMQYYDTNTPFDRNVRNNSEAVTKGDFNRDLTSQAPFWAVHITSGFQGYVAKDNDPDTEQAVQGLQYGVTGDSTPFMGAQRRAGALVHMETIRDDKRGIMGPMLVLEQYTVVHKSGHQFLLEHEDGRFPNPNDTDPSDDYIMTDKTDQTGMSPNVSFSAASLNKLRNITYPPQGE